jgi:hypothetical protein
MKRVTVLFLAAILLGACNAPKPTSGTIAETVKIEKNMKEEYHSLTETDRLSNFMDKKVCFEGKIATMIHQHMMRGSFDGKQQEHYFDPLEKYSFGQMVVYYSPEKVIWPEDKEKQVKIYGTVGEVSGAGKGGGTHSEYYLDVDKVE